MIEIARTLRNKSSVDPRLPVRPNLILRQCLKLPPHEFRNFGKRIFFIRLG